MIPYKDGDRSNVNTHLKSTHNMQGTAAVVKEGNKQAKQVSIAGSLKASANSGLGTNRCAAGCVLRISRLAFLKYLPVCVTSVLFRGAQLMVLLHFVLSSKRRCALGGVHLQANKNKAVMMSTSYLSLTFLHVYGDLVFVLALGLVGQTLLPIFPD